ncbi:hypothetical protein CPB83DRAFT_834865 [Crepidotus variabilis]|uniref:Uncharacterized protein n=1 Tax=Crepidotus variabilis TaxID=179855 RepID=A0A9P6EJ09_9AGAR|nr:hypothetical protein CPB83DRAFT_834865 [Crepidotus variabilis]
MSEWIVIEGNSLQRLRSSETLEGLQLLSSIRLEYPKYSYAMPVFSPALRNLEICFDFENLPVVSAMLELASFPLLCGITFTITNCSNLQTDHLPNCMTLFGNFHKSFPKSLHMVTVQQQFEHPANMPFVSFMEWMPSDIRQIVLVKTHPALENLIFDFQQSPQLTMDIVVDVALHSPRLNFPLLEVNLDTSLSLDVFPVSFHNLTELWFISAPPSNPLVAARQDNVLGDKWEELDEALKALQGGRKDERQRVDMILQGLKVAARSPLSILIGLWSK